MIYLKSRSLHKQLLFTISYFSFFGYAPSFDDIFTFFPVKISRKRLKTLIHEAIKKKKVVSYDYRPHTNTGGIPFSKSVFEKNSQSFKKAWQIYTLPQYSNHFKNSASRQQITLHKLDSINQLIKSLYPCPFIRLVGITGSAAMSNCRKQDDIDLMIVTQGKSMFTARFIAILLTSMFGLRKKKGGICLNLFLSEEDLSVPLHKQTQYVAHELLQMKAVINKNNTYGKFCKANEWVYDIYPNSKVPPSLKLRTTSKNQNTGILLEKITNGIVLLLQPFEFALKQIQLKIIRKNKTGLILSPTQLWLFRRDFEKRIKGLFSKG
ncbi:MAG: hypothetical protein WC489_06725 [Patescibacteria group bacterium]